MQQQRPKLIGSIVCASVALWMCGSCSRLAENGHSPTHVSGRLSSQPAPRKDYRFSVVPGGVYSGEELRAARNIDRVVAAHYADFGDNATATTLADSTLYYVSYRVADHVFWTARRHRIAAGERVLSDGKHLARARCGNRLSKEAQAPTRAKGEPTASDLVQGETPSGGPVVPVIAPPSLTSSPLVSHAEIPPEVALPGQSSLVLAPVAELTPPHSTDVPWASVPALSTPGLSFGYPVQPGGAHSTPKPPGPVIGPPIGFPLPAPEPSSMVLVSAGGALVASRYLRRRLRAPSVRD